MSKNISKADVEAHNTPDKGLYIIVRRLLLEPTCVTTNGPRRSIAMSTM